MQDVMQRLATIEACLGIASKKDQRMSGRVLTPRKGEGGETFRSEAFTPPDDIAWTPPEHISEDEEDLVFQNCIGLQASLQKSI